MWLNHLFIDSPIDFEKRCRNRVWIGVLFLVLGAAALALSFVARDRVMVMYLEPGYTDYIPGFYWGTGAGLVAAGIISIIRNVKYLKNPELGKKRKIYETDERNRMLGLRCWAYTGYTMMLTLYIGILVSGFISLTVSKTLMVVAAFYAVVLFVFRRLLQKAMEEALAVPGINMPGIIIPDCTGIKKVRFPGAGYALSGKSYFLLL